MTTPYEHTHDYAVEESNRKKRRVTGLIAGVAGLLLLLGGSSFALWTQTAGLATNDINNGTLDISAAPTSAQVWYDVSSDRLDNTTTMVDGATTGQVINLSSFNLIPGDTIEGDLTYVTALKGDNMVADLQLSASAAPTLNGVSLKYNVFTSADGETWTAALSEPAAITLTTTPQHIMYLQAAKEVSEPDVVSGTTIPVISATAIPTAGATPNVKVVIYAYFADPCTGTVAPTGCTTYADLASALQTINVSLTQTRYGTSTWFPTSPAPAS
jgi:alternate signal-mediated exported protein